jgi:PTH1 family peptidyl-tRNA hydrolase
MGLFAKQPIRLSQDVPYTISLNTKIKLIIGLGNPGKEHEKTRHNLGFMVLDDFAKENNFEPFKENKKFKSQISEKNIGPIKVILIKPQTFMNLSGEPAQAISHYYNVKNDSIIAVHDELGIPFGQIRSRLGGQSAGHNGVKSLINHLGPEFGRVRMGIKNSDSPKSEDSDFVLGKFNPSEQKLLPNILKEANAILTEFIYGEKLPQDTRNILL